VKADSKHYKIKTNYKYVSKTPVSKYLVANFNRTITHIISQTPFNSLLDAGCGEGVSLSLLEPYLKNIPCTGFDLDDEHINMSRENAPFCTYQVADIYNLPFEKNSFDMVMCLEVMEHLEDPEKALRQLVKLSSDYLIVSVPREPVWRFLNMVRGKYWKHWGNTPGHLNHWSSGKIKKMISKHARVIAIYKPLPWTILLCKID
jgi:2-polyprenyl-3-methyl-5-hydroxy-6-metoxy-1,4-benzoquinol methylase